MPVLHRQEQTQNVGARVRVCRMPPCAQLGHMPFTTSESALLSESLSLSIGSIQLECVHSFRSMPGLMVAHCACARFLPE